MDLMIWLAFQKEGATNPKSSISPTPSSSAEDDENGVWLEVIRTLDTNMLSAMSSSFKWTNRAPPIVQDLPSQMIRMEADENSDPEHCGPAATSAEGSAGLALPTQFPRPLSPTQQHLLLPAETGPIDPPQSPSSPGSDRFFSASMNDSQRTMVLSGSSFTTSFHEKLILSPDFPMSPFPLPPTGFTPGTSPESRSKIQRSRILEDAPTVDPAAVMPQEAHHSPSQETTKPFLTGALVRSPSATPGACSGHTIQQEFSHDVLRDSQLVDHDADVTGLNNEAQARITTSRQLERSASMEPERPPPQPRLRLRFHSDPPHTTPKLQDVPNADILPIPLLQPAGMPSRRSSVFVEISGNLLGSDDATSAPTAAPQRSPSKRKRSTSSSDISNESRQASPSPVFPTPPSPLPRTRGHPWSTIKIARNRRKSRTTQAWKAIKLRKLEVSEEEKDGNDDGRKDETGLQTSSPMVEANAIPSTSGGTAMAQNALRNQPNGKPLMGEFR